MKLYEASAFPVPYVLQYLNWFQCAGTCTSGGLPAKHTIFSNMICKLDASGQITWHWSKIGAHCIVHGLGWALRFENPSYTRNTLLILVVPSFFSVPLSLFIALSVLLLLPIVVSLGLNRTGWQLIHFKFIASHCCRQSIEAHLALWLRSCAEILLRWRPRWWRPIQWARRIGRKCCPHNSGGDLGRGWMTYIE